MLLLLPKNEGGPLHPLGPKSTDENYSSMLNLTSLEDEETFVDGVFTDSSEELVFQQEQGEHTTLLFKIAENGLKRWEAQRQAVRRAQEEEEKEELEQMNKWREKLARVAAAIKLLLLLCPPHRLPLGLPPLQPILSYLEEQGGVLTLLLLKKQLFQGVGKRCSNKGFFILQTGQIEHRLGILVGAFRVQRMEGPSFILGQQQHAATGAKTIYATQDSAR